MVIEHCSHRFKKIINISNKKAIWKCVYCKMKAKIDFNLKEKRKELLKYFKEQFCEDSLIPEDILRVVEKQDKEFIKKLKDLARDNMDWKDYDEFKEKIDNLSGKDLI